MMVLSGICLISTMLVWTTAWKRTTTVRVITSRVKRPQNKQIHLSAAQTNLSRLTPLSCPCA